jgi:hypothetical protein
MKRTIWIFVFVGVHALLNAQRNPFNEVLVYFETGLTQETTFVSGKELKRPKISSPLLRDVLKGIGVEESMIEIALPSFNKTDTLKLLSDGTMLSQLDMTRLFRISLDNELLRDQLIRKLYALPQVLYAEPNGIAYHCAIVPNDDDFGEQWNLRNLTTVGADIHATQAWDIYTGDQNNIIAVIDGGVENNHIDLDDKIIGGDVGYGWNGHGVHVAGIAGAETNNSEGIAGVDWNARIHSQRIDNAGDLGDLYQAIVDAVNYSPNVKVLNHSWSIIDGYDEYSRPTPGDYSITVAMAFAYANKANRINVAAMGNHEVYLPGEIQYPAGYENVIAVGASDITDEIADFSVSGSNIDVSAPGVNIFSTLPNNNYGNLSGTSMATPHVSGLASLLRGYNPNLSNDDIFQLITISCDDINYAGDPQIGPGYDLRSGFGRINAESALNLLTAPNTLKQWDVTGGTIYSTSSTYKMSFYGISGLASGAYLVKRHEVRKVITFPEPFLETIDSWGRGVFTTGWSRSSPNYGEGFCEIVPGTLTNTGATFRTYVYQLWNVLGQYYGYYPTTPSNINFSYSVLGIPNPTLTGPSSVCSTSSTYYLNNLPPGAIVNWATSANISIINSDSFSCTVTSNGSGPGWVEANINGIQDPLTLNQNVDVGIPEIDFIYFSNSVDGGEYWCSNAIGNQFEIQTNFMDGYCEYRLKTLGGSILEQGYTTYYGEINGYHSPGYYLLEVRTIGACGTGDWFETEIEYLECGGDGEGEWGMNVFPNPAETIVTIDFYTLSSSGLKEPLTNSSNASKHNIQIYVKDNNLRILKSLISNGELVSLDVSDMLPGIYFIEASTKSYRKMIPLIVGKKGM